MKKSKSPSKRTPAAETRNKAAKPLRDLKVAKGTGTRVRGGVIIEDYGLTAVYEK